MHVCRERLFSGHRYHLFWWSIYLGKVRTLGSSVTARTRTCALCVAVLLVAERMREYVRVFFSEEILRKKNRKRQGDSQ